jgi:hypothetical protein
VRHFLAILLLLAAAGHPLAHLTHEDVVCPCVHGAEVAVEPPSISAAPAIAQPQFPAPRALASIAVDSEVPARAPPVA